MNNLTKLAALPTGGGCQSALRPEDKGVERKPLSYREWSKLAWDEFFRCTPIISAGDQSPIATGGIVGKTPDKVLADIADDGYVVCKSTQGFNTITAAEQPGDQVEAVSIESGEGPCIGVWPTLTLNFAGPLDEEEFTRNWRAMNNKLDARAALRVWQDDRQVWPEKCRVTFNVEGKVTERTQAQVADSVRRANLKGGAA